MFSASQTWCLFAITGWRQGTREQQRVGMFYSFIRNFENLYVSNHLIGLSRVLINMYLVSFRDCYPNVNIFPKQHYMIHFHHKF